ncbi:transposase [Streptosporangium carneum]|uniref:transposase n=1 Tax=Streptosporangium carneum TaxID=47481 RepID=UPI0022F2FF69|nr:transposase [Streptosporangium carneum]
MENGLKRHDLTEDEWVRLAPLLPAQSRRGQRWADHRMIINGVFFRNRADCSWRALPEIYGRWKTVYNRHRRWSADGTWEAILEALRADDDTTGEPGLLDHATATTAGPLCGSSGSRPTPRQDIRPGKMFELSNW